jgi:hypothetical protein
MPGKSGRKTKVQQRAANIRIYGITVAEYNRIHDQQQGLCAICKQTNNKKSLCIDHDHATGEVRGLLCDKCNRGLGLFQDNITLLRQAIGYLHQGPPYFVRGKLVKKLGYRYTERRVYQDKITNENARWPWNQQYGWAMYLKEN